jgi:hypothetical protein
MNIGPLAERANSAYLRSISGMHPVYSATGAACERPSLDGFYSDNWIGCWQVPARARSHRGERRNPVPACGLGIV